MERENIKAYFAEGIPNTGIELLFQGTTEVVGNSDVVLIVLTDRQQQRQITMLADKWAERELTLRRGNTGVVGELLPEVLCKVFPRMCADSFLLFIYGVDDGKYQVALVDVQTLDATPIRASDAILLSLVAGLKIYIEGRLFSYQSVPFDATGCRMALPLNTLSMDMLRQTLDKAVAAEDYELASMIKKEMEQRMEGRKEHNERKE